VQSVQNVVQLHTKSAGSMMQHNKLTAGLLPTTQVNVYLKKSVLFCRVFGGRASELALLASLYFVQSLMLIIFACIIQHFGISTYSMRQLAVFMFNLTLHLCFFLYHTELVIKQIRSTRNII
jgi:hypothetical protein